jgi:hypothetical protein
VTLNERIDAFHSLGQYLRNPDVTNRHSLLHEPIQFNPWFTPDQVELAISNVGRLLHRERLTTWTSRYPSVSKPLNVGVVMAGNIPLVGFHDALSVLLSGHRLLAKTSSQDRWLILHLLEKLMALEPRFADSITIKEQLRDVDAVIATGSDNTSRYFEYYFRKIPNLIRRNRSSVSILTGSESEQQIASLGMDIFSFYGLGCRNVSKLFVPTGYDVRTLAGLWPAYEKVIHHHKYANNYDYNKSIMLVNRTPFVDNGFVLLTESPAIVSPISVLYFEEYNDDDALRSRLAETQSKIQCMVGLPSKGLTMIPFGKAQFPEIDDYADGVDTMSFLTTTLN